MDVSTGKHGKRLGKIHSISEKANTSYQHKYLRPDSSEEGEGGGGGEGGGLLQAPSTTDAWLNLDLLQDSSHMNGTTTHGPKGKY